MNDDSIAKHMYCHVLSVLLTGQKKKKKKKRILVTTLTFIVCPSQFVFFKITKVMFCILYIKAKAKMLEEFSEDLLKNFSFLFFIFISPTPKQFFVYEGPAV